MFGKRKKERKKLRPTSLQFDRRALVVKILASLCFVALVGVLFLLQLIRGPELQKKAVDQQLQDVTLKAARGTIYDRNLKPLAESVGVWTVSVAPSDLLDRDKKIMEEKRKEVATRLSQLLEMDYEKIYEICGKKSQYEKIMDNIDVHLKEKILALKDEFSNKIRGDQVINGVIYLEPSYKRSYPYNEFASAVLGYVGWDSEGQGGLEGQYDSFLTGTPGRLIAPKDAVGKDMPYEYDRRIDALDGADLVLTIDEVIQHYVEKNMKAAIETNKVAKRACAIMMDVNTGEILSMSVQEGFDPNNAREIYNEEKREEIGAMPEATKEEKEAKNEAELAAMFDQWRNKAISDTYEPGSVFKIITAAIGLEEGLAAANQGHFVCNGAVQVGGWNIHCHKAGGHGVQNFSQIVQNSCNPGFIQLGQTIGVDKFTSYFEAFGLTEKTGLDLPGEMNNTNLYHTKEKMGIVELSSSSFGQSFGVTPIQMITAIAAATNGGYLLEPHLVKQIVDGDGNIVKTINKTVKRQVISEETSKELCGILETVVSQGTGKNAYVEGYQVAGKTGTSEKLGSEDDQARIASFCGIAPAEDPQVALLLLFDEPNGISKYGSVVAAPVFSNIMRDVLPYLGVEKHYTQEELENLDATAPNLSGMTKAEAEAAAREAGLEIRIVGSGDKVIRQMPVAGQNIPKGGKIVAYTDGASTDNMVEVPDFVGKTLSEVNQLAAQYDLNLSLSRAVRQGEVVECSAQNFAAGEKVARGTIIKVDFVALDRVE